MTLSKDQMDWLHQKCEEASKLTRSRLGCENLRGVVIGDLGEALGKDRPEWLRPFLLAPDEFTLVPNGSVYSPKLYELLGTLPFLDHYGTLVTGRHWNGWRLK